jgi:CheY-like chemotaxis protein
VVTANDVDGALRALEDARIPIVLCERELGKDDTWKTLLAGLAQLEDPPFLIVGSRSADESLWAEALNLGAYDVLARPFEPSEVMRTLCLAWLRWNEAGRPVRRRPEAVADPFSFPVQQAGRFSRNVAIPNQGERPPRVWKFLRWLSIVTLIAKAAPHISARIRESRQLAINHRLRSLPLDLSWTRIGLLSPSGLPAAARQG